MTGFPQPPITQWRIRQVRGGETFAERLVNDFAKLGPAVSEEIGKGVDWQVDDVIVEGRRRMNDYVGSPLWSDWERVQA